MAVPEHQAWMLPLFRRPWGLALLLLFAGCATPNVPASYGDQAGPRVQRPAPVKSGTRVRAPTHPAARLLDVPVALLAILLWPSELDGEALSLEWTNTLNPVTGLPWSSQEEYDGFWRLPQQERERLIQASRNAQGGSKPFGATPESRSASGAGARRHPNQTCDDAVLDHLQAEKNRICNAMPGASCSTASNSAKRLARMPCSQIRLRIQALRNCINIRWFIQDECFGGVPDTRHQEVLSEYENGLVQCQSLEAVNCAPGHSMAEL